MPIFLSLHTHWLWITILWCEQCRGKMEFHTFFIQHKTNLWQNQVAMPTTKTRREKKIVQLNRRQGKRKTYQRNWNAEIEREQKEKAMAERWKKKKQIEWCRTNNVLLLCFRRWLMFHLLSKKNRNREHAHILTLFLSLCCVAFVNFEFAMKNCGSTVRDFPFFAQTDKFPFSLRCVWHFVVAHRFLIETVQHCTRKSSHSVRHLFYCAIEASFFKWCFIV